MSFTFRSAVRERIGLLIGLAGASGSGKSLSALRLARGMCHGDDSKIAFIDTEAGRGLHYAPAKGQQTGQFVFAFKHGDMVAPFSPERYLEAILAAEKDGAEVIVIDSYSHLWNSEGGLQDIHDEIVAAQVEAARKAHTGNWKFDEVKTAERLSVGAWREPKGRNNRFVNRLLQCRSHLIFAMRADEKIRIEKVRENGRERTVIVQAKDMPPKERWVPICEKRFMFELTTSIILSPENPGVPIPIKLSGEHRAFFPEGQPISEEAGRQMAEWARGAVAPPVEKTPTRIKRREAEAPVEPLGNQIGPTFTPPPGVEHITVIVDGPGSGGGGGGGSYIARLDLREGRHDAPQNAPEAERPAAEAPAPEVAAPAAQPYHNALDTKVMMRDADWTLGDSETEFWLPTQGGDLAYWFNEEVGQCANRADKTHLRTFWSYNGDALKRIKEGDPATYKALEKMKDQARAKIGGTK